MVVSVLGVGFLNEHEGLGVDETADVINMPMSIVAHRAGDEPEHIGDAEVLLEGLIHFLASEARIAHLDFWVEVTLFGGQQSASAIDLDAPAFEDEILAARLGVEKRFA